jgi:hypothetical protein
MSIFINVKICLFVLIVILVPSCVSQKMIYSADIAPDYFILVPGIRTFEIDLSGNIYAVDDTDRILKIDTAGRLAYKVVNPNLGKLHSIDAGNPFKLFTFYRDQQTIIMYDNTLSEIQRIVLAKWGLHDVTAACLSADNAIWLFEGTTRKLMKMSETGDALLTSDPFDIIRPASMRPDQLVDTDQWLLARQESQPIAIFNDFGNFISQLEAPDQRFSVASSNIVFWNENLIRRYTLASGRENSMSLKFNPAQHMHLYNDAYIASDAKGIYMLKI